MSEKIIVPALGESVTEATVSKWLKTVGEEVNSDEPLVELETDKVNVEVPSPSDGILEKISVKEGTTVEVGTLLGSVGANDVKPVTEKKEKKYTPPPKKEIEGGAQALGPLLFVRLPERPAQSYRGVVEPEEPDNAPSHPGHLLGSVPPLRGPRLPLPSGEDPVKSLGVTLPLALLPFPFSFRFARRGEERRDGGRFSLGDSRQN